MTPTKLKKIVLAALEDMKAQDVADLNIKKLTDIADRMIICTGTSRRHTQSIADNVAEKVKAAGGTVIGIEGKTEGDWVLVDLGDIIVHVMLAETRQFYSLEKLWMSIKESRDNEN